MEASTSQNGTRRLIIREMVLENFKSYAGEQRVGPFHKCFSSVVGPNGSGKSNVIDALLFVFGRRAKQEGEEFQVVPDSQFVVSRSANKNNTSDYYIQNRKVSAKDVAELLKGKGVDLENNRFLILQGEVEQISLMKPKGEEKGDVGLLEYLEDLIGTDKYVEPIEEAAKRLEQINEQRHTMIQRLKGAERERDKLEGAKTEAEAYLTKQATAVQKRLSANRLYMQQSKNHIELYTGQLAELQEKLEHTRGKLGRYDNDGKSSDKELKLAEKEHQRVQKSLTDAEAEFKELEKRDHVYHEDLKHLEQRIKKATSKMDADVKTLKKLDTETTALLKEAPAERQRAEQMAAELQAQEQKLEVMMEEIKGEVEQLRQQLQAVKKELAPWEKQMQEVKAAVDVATSEKQLLAGRQAEAQKRLEAAQSGLSDAKKAVQERGRAITALEGKLGTSQQAIQDAEQQLEARKEEEAAADEAVRKLRGKVETLRVDVSSQRSAGGIVKALMAAKASGTIPGIFGRLGDLAAIDGQYDVAVSTACGALDYILVESTADAQRCVELLRVQGLGVATFLILEKQAHLQQAASQQVQTPEGVPRLFDLVRVSDPRLKPAFYFALGNTVVAKDLDQASRIAYGGDRRFSRVVTLQGELISESGTMSGGGGKPKGGRMALGSAAPRNVDAKAAAAELARTEKELEDASQALQTARQAVTAAQSALTAAERSLAALEVELPKARMEAAAQATRAQDLQARLAELEAATQVGVEEAARLHELQADIDAGAKKLQQLQTSASGLQSKATGLEKQLESVGGEPLKRQKARVASLQEEVAGLEAGATKKEVQARANQKQVEKINKELEKQEAERTKHAADVERIKAEVAAMEDTAVEVLQRVQTAQAELEQHAAKLTELRAERDVRMAELGKVKDAIASTEAAIAKLNSECKLEKNNITKWTKLVAEGEAELTQLNADIPMLEEHELEGSDEQLRKRIDDLLYAVLILEQEMAAMSPDMAAIEEWRKKDADCTAKRDELESATQERNQIARGHEELRKKRLDEFMAGFNNISLRLKELYQCITLGGDAELELVDSLDPFSEGIVFSVRPPKKSWKNIGHLSGGEKTLSSLALVFALHGYKPTPLYVMDEIDAALDFKNVSIVGHYIKERTKNAQFIIISLRNNMFELADRLVGIYKTDNTTKTVTITPAAFVVGGQQAAQATESPQQQQMQLERMAPAVVA